MLVKFGGMRVFLAVSIGVLTELLTYFKLLDTVVGKTYFQNYVSTFRGEI